VIEILVETTVMFGRSRVLVPRQVAGHCIREADAEAVHDDEEENEIIDDDVEVDEYDDDDDALMELLLGSNIETEDNGGAEEEEEEKGAPGRLPPSATNLETAGPGRARLWPRSRDLCWMARGSL